MGNTSLHSVAVDQANPANPAPVLTGYFYFHFIGSSADANVYIVGNTFAPGLNGQPPLGALPGVPTYALKIAKHVAANAALLEEKQQIINMHTNLGHLQTAINWFRTPTTNPATRPQNITNAINAVGLEVVAAAIGAHLPVTAAQALAAAAAAATPGVPLPAKIVAVHQAVQAAILAVAAAAGGAPGVLDPAQLAENAARDAALCIVNVQNVNITQPNTISTIPPAWNGMLLDYYNGGELFDFLRTWSRYTISANVTEGKKRLRVFLKHVMLALQQLRFIRVNHGDLHHHNVLVHRIGQQTYLKIIDFGRARAYTVNEASSANTEDDGNKRKVTVLANRRVTEALGIRYDRLTRNGTTLGPIMQVLKSCYQPPGITFAEILANTTANADIKNVAIPSDLSAM